MRTLLLLVAALLMISGCSRDSSAAGAAAPPPAAVQIKVASPQPVNQSSEYVAMLKSRRSTTVMPLVDGQVTHIFVKSGDHVLAGTPLLQIDPLKQQATTGSEEANRSAKTAAVRLAEQQFERTSKLFTEGVTSRQSLDESRAALDSARSELKATDARVSEQHIQLRYYKVVASTSGVVGDIPVHVGDRVTPATVLTTVDQPGDIEAYIEVPVERARDLAINKQVQLLGGDGKVVAESRISFVSPQVDEQSQTVLAKAVVANSAGALRTSQLTRARVIWGSQPGITVPVLAVTRINGQFFAFLAEDVPGKGLIARQRQVSLGDIIGNDYIVLDGIKAGEKIIVSGTQGLADGMPVAPQG